MQNFLKTLVYISSIAAEFCIGKHWRRFLRKQMAEPNLDITATSDSQEESMAKKKDLNESSATEKISPTRLNSSWKKGQNKKTWKKRIR